MKPETRLSPWRTPCFWAVLLTLLASAPAEAFEHPDLAEDDSWRGSWVGVTAPASSNQWIALRKSFILNHAPESASTRIAADSKYWLWLNGRRVVFEGGLKRGPTPRDTYFDQLDLAPHLKPGTNTLAILLWYFGKEGFSHKDSGQSALLFELEAGPHTILSDGSWKARLHPAFGHTGPPHPNFRLPESNIRFDATRDLSGWEQPGFDDGDWPAAAEFGRPPCAPWNRLVRRTIPQWKDYGLKPYENSPDLPRVSDGSLIKVRLPHNAQVTPWFKIEACAGRVIRIQTDNYRGGGPPNVRAEYVTRDGKQDFEGFGWMNGHEVIYDIPAGIKVLNLQYRETGYDTEFTGAFACDDAFFNQLRQKALRTLYITMRDTYMDCPDRERAQWWGDVVNELGEAFYALDRKADALARKGMLELIGWQKTDGVLFSPVPAGNWDKDLPLQMLASIGRPGFWTYALYSGDLDTLRAVYPGMKRYLATWKMQPDGLVVHRPGAWAWGDWGDNVDMTILYNAWYHLGLQGMRESARALGHTSDLPWIDSRLAAMDSAFNPAFWNGSEYRSPDFLGQTDDRANALAVVAGLARPEQFPALLKVFESQEHASPYMEKYVLEALCLMDQPTFAQDRIRRRYAKMVNHDTTTLWEGWGIGGEGFGGGTINHAWSGGPLTIMSQYFAGIAPTSPGFATYQVRPRMGSLSRITCSLATARGDIELSLRRGQDDFSLDVFSPVGTQAQVGIPQPENGSFSRVAVNGEEIWNSGKTAASHAAVRFVQATPRFLMFDVPPGAYSFRAKQSTGSPR